MTFYSRALTRILISIAITLASYITALALRFEFELSEMFSEGRLFPTVYILLTLRVLAGFYWGLSKSGWRYFSVDDVIRIAKAHLSSTICFGALIYLLRFDGYPRSILFIELTLSLLIASAARLAFRLTAEKVSGNKNKPGTIQQAIVLGAGDTGHMLVKYLLSSPRFGIKPVAVLDDHPRHQGAHVFGIPVIGRLSDLAFQLETRPEVSAVLVAIPSLSSSRIKELEELCKSLNVSLKQLQQFADIACLELDEDPQTKISIESALNCEVNIPQDPGVSRLLKDKIVLITGAGGSIGSELSRQVLAYKPKQLVLLDSSEFNLFSIDREIGTNIVRPVLASVIDHSALQKAFSDYKPEVVFHAAAYKHVPLLEFNPRAAFLNNVIGVKNVLLAAASSGVEQFIMISSDKAVGPTNVMGATKNIGEHLVREFMQNSSLNASIVRFGNVINSAGSVIPIFRDQIRSGGPLTVTHPEVERFFMSIPEAVRLILSAASLKERGALYVLDMGKRMKVVDVAKKLIALYGRRDIPITFIGLRPGEKLLEELTDDHEHTVTTPLARVNQIVGNTQVDRSIWEWSASVEKSLSKLSDEALREELLSIVQEITPDKNKIAAA